MSVFHSSELAPRTVATRFRRRHQVATVTLALGAALLAIGATGIAPSAEAASLPSVSLYPGASGPTSNVVATNVPAGTQAFWVESY